MKPWRIYPLNAGERRAGIMKYVSDCNGFPTDVMTFQHQAAEWLIEEDCIKPEYSILLGQEWSNETLAKAIVELDASMMAGPESAEETSHNNYPFQKPRAVLIEGACYFPPGSPIEDGASVEVDCDWTPSYI